MSFPKYQSLRDSCVEWIGEVPSHWAVQPLKRHARLLTVKTDRRDHPVALENIESWTGRFVPTETEFEGEGVAFDAGDVLFGKLRPYLAKTLVAESSGEAVGDFLVMRPAEVANSRFVAYQLRSREVISIIDGSTFGSKMPRASWDFVGSMPTALPPPSEQAAIVTFLDRETAKIDALVEEQKRLIELLKEMRQAVISQAVTKGLENVPMKDSGVEWLGKVPAHWQVVKVKYLCSRISSGKTPSGGSETYVDEGITFLRSQNVHDDGLQVEDVVYIDYLTDAAMASSRAMAGDILLNITGASIGRTCKLPKPFPPANVNQHVCVLRCKEESVADFVAWFLKSSMAKMYMAYIQNGAARDGLNFEQIGNLLLALPTSDERALIVDHLSQQYLQFSELISRVEESVALLHERRSALISAAVTGKIDVRGLAPQ